MSSTPPLNNAIHHSYLTLAYRMVIWTSFMPSKKYNDIKTPKCVQGNTWHDGSRVTALYKTPTITLLLFPTPVASVPQSWPRV